MKIQSKLNHNLGLNLPHSKSGGVPGRIQIPAGATMEFSDEEWDKYKDCAAEAIKSGGLVVLVPTKGDAKLQEEKKLDDAKKLVGSQESAKSTTAKSTTAKDKKFRVN